MSRLYNIEEMNTMGWEQVPNCIGPQRIRQKLNWKNSSMKDTIHKTPLSTSKQSDTYTPKIDDYVRWQGDEGWVYFVCPDYYYY